MEGVTDDGAAVKVDAVEVGAAPAAGAAGHRQGRRRRLWLMAFVHKEEED